jgi:hypothetical protein
MTDIIDQQPAITLFLGLGLILLVLCVIITWTTRISFRINKVEPPGSKPLFAIAFLQIILGITTLLTVKYINDEPFLSIGCALAMTLLSGLVLIKWRLKKNWKQALYLWAVAAVLQLAALPVVAAILLVILFAILYWLYPPQY